MRPIKITDIKENHFSLNNKKNKFFFYINSLINYQTILILNIIINGYLFIDNIRHNRIIKDILDFKDTFDQRNNSFKNNYPHNDKELIGLYYPDINFTQIKARLMNFNIIASIIELINELENKLIYLEKDINLTKIVSFYTSRKILLKGAKIQYNEKNLTELHEKVNWITIHKSNQLKGIASDKYLACKYVKLKLGKNLCKQRIAVYDRFEDLNFTKLREYGDIALKISNSCWKTFFIAKNTTIKIFNGIMDRFKKSLESDHGLIEAQFFHLYAKKRILVERQFIPNSDLYEFKFMIVNKKIKFIYFYYKNKGQKFLIYDKNYNFLYKDKINTDTPLNIKAMFKKHILEKMKDYAIKLSGDFPYFIRVDLYFFHDKIYLSELTFASVNGFPFHRNKTFVKDAANNFSFIDYYD